MKKSNQKSLTLNTLLASFAADIDIFLLCEEDQKTTRDSVYTPGEIRAQLEKSIIKLDSMLESIGFDIHEPLKASRGMKNMSLIK